MNISSDKDFKAALGALGDVERRQVAARLVLEVFDLSGDSRVKAALDSAARADASDSELDVAAAGVNTARVESFTQCGRDTDWRSQARHFVARAAQQCVKPALDVAQAWDAAMQARMARLCMSLAAGEGTGDNGADAQFRALDTILKSKGLGS